MQKHAANQNIDRFELLVNKGNKEVVHISLKAGQEIGRHDSPKSIFVIIYKGKLEFSSDEEIFTITPGEFIEAEPGEFHALRAIEDSELFVVKGDLK